MMNKRTKAWLLCMLMLCSVLALCACKDDKASDTPTTAPQTQPSTEVTEPDTTGPSIAEGEALYKVTLVDGAGNPYTDRMIVTIMQNGEKVTMLRVNEQGTVEKVLPKGDYTVSVSSIDAEVSFYYDEASAVLSADKTEATIMLVNELGDSFQTIHATSPTLGEMLPYDAYSVSTGSTHVELTPDDRSFFLFVPTEPGTYEFSVTDDAATIGIYGASVHFIQSVSVEEVIDNKITVSVNAGMIGEGNTGTTVYVIGLDSSEGAEDCILNIIRTGDPAWSITVEPWIEYSPEIEIKPYTLPEGIVFKTFDLSAATGAYDLVLNEDDGTYHLDSADGPRVFVQLSEAVYGISMKDMVGEIVYQDGVLIPTGTAPFRYFYDNGPDDFFKEEYTEAMRQYVTNRDQATGVYPLTKDLYYILPMGMKNIGWLRSDTVNYLFSEVNGFNPEIGWLFLCVYEDVSASVPQVPTDPTGPSEPAPTEPQPTQPTARPTEPTVKPTEPTVKPTEPTITEPTVTEPIPTEPAPEPPIEDNKDAPIMIGGTLEFEAEVKANHLVYYDLLRYNDTTLTIRSEDAYVVYKGNKYEPVNGVVQVPNLQVQYTNQPIQVAIGNKGTEDATFTVTFTYPLGHAMNPISLELGTFVTDVEEGDEQGLYYHYTAAADGTFTITLDDITAGVRAGITITCVTVKEDGLEIPRQVSFDEAEGNALSVDVKAGEKITVVISTLPKDNKYPAATITTTASFS